MPKAEEATQPRKEAPPTPEKSLSEVVKEPLVIEFTDRDGKRREITSQGLEADYFYYGGPEFQQRLGKEPSGLERLRATVGHLYPSLPPESQKAIFVRASELLKKEGISPSDPEVSLFRLFQIKGPELIAEVTRERVEAKRPPISEEDRARLEQFGRLDQAARDAGVEEGITGVLGELTRTRETLKTLTRVEEDKTRLEKERPLRPKNKFKEGDTIKIKGGQKLSKPHVLKTPWGKIELEEELGKGLTAKVLAGYARETTDQPVIAKIRRPHLSEAFQRKFEEEAFTLSRLMAAEERRGDGLHIVPEYFGMDTDAENPYIIQGRVMGEQIPDLLKRYDCLEEPLALKIGWQFARLLTVLHEDLRQTYRDLKFENIWWTGEQIKVTDWNVLSEEGNLEEMDWDLKRWGENLFKMLTGSNLPDRWARRMIAVPYYGHGKLENFPGWEHLTAGTQEILKKLLHPNPAKRYQTAEELMKGLKGQWELWKKDAKELTTLAREAATSLETKDKEKISLEELLFVKNFLQIIIQREDTSGKAKGWAMGKMRIIDSQIEELRESFYETGRRLIENGDVEGARERFEKWITHEPHNSKAQRWYYFSKTREERANSMKEQTEELRELRESKSKEQIETKPLTEAWSKLNEEIKSMDEKIKELERERNKFIEAFKRNFPELVKIMDDMDEGDYSSAIERFSDLDIKEFNWLLEEAKARQAIEKAGEQRGSRNYKEAMRAYQEASKHLEAVPYKDILIDEFGDLKNLTEEMRKRAQTVGKALEQLRSGQEFLNGKRFQQAYECFQRGFGFDPTNPDLLEACLNTGKSLIEQGRSEMALEFFLLGKAFSSGSIFREEFERLSSEVVSS